MTRCHRTLVVVLLAVALAGCGGEPQGCAEPSGRALAGLEAGQDVPGVSIGWGSAESLPHEGGEAVAATITGDGVDGVGVWYLGPSGSFSSGDSLAEAFSSWPLVEGIDSDVAACLP